MDGLLKSMYVYMSYFTSGQNAKLASSQLSNVLVISLSPKKIREYWAEARYMSNYGGHREREKTHISAEEKIQILRAVRMYDSKKKAARALGMSYDTFKKRLIQINSENSLDDRVIS